MKKISVTSLKNTKLKINISDQLYDSNLKRQQIPTSILISINIESIVKNLKIK